MSKPVYSEAQIERAVQEAMEKVNEKEHKNGASGKQLFLKTPWHDDAFEMGSIFEAETVKGHKNYVVFIMVNNGHVIYCHGDRAKKVPTKNFVDLIGDGDLNFVPKDKRDPEKLALSVMGLMAMSHGISFNDYMKQIWDKGHGSDANKHFR